MTIRLFICFVNYTNMTNIDIKKLKNIFAALNNEKRIQIINLCIEKPLTVTDLSKKLNLNYSITVEYTSMLEKANLIVKERNEDRTVSVKSLIKIKDSGEIVRV